MSMKILMMTLLLFAEAPQGVSKEDYFRRQCDAGDQHACEKLAEIEEGLVYQQRLEKRSNDFWNEINTDELMLDKKTPDLQDVYPLVMRDFIKMEAEQGSAEELDEERLPQCALHYHNHWVNRKMWWPRLEDGTPDWPGIYNYIVDHYYGYCLRPH